MSQFLKFKFTVLFLTGFLFAESLCGQDKLSLADAIERGLKNNLDIIIVKDNQSIARLNNNWGQAGRYPTINFTGNQNNNAIQRKPANPFAIAGRNITNNMNGQLDVQFTIFDGFSIKLTKDRLNDLERLSDGNTNLVIETTLQSIMLAYYQALVDKDNLTVLRRNLSYSKERYEFVKLKKELGSAISFDVLQEQNNFLTDSANVLQQEIRFKDAIRNLNLLLSDSINRTYELTDSLYFQDETFTYEDLRLRANRSNTILRNQFINQEILRTGVQLENANLFPSLVLNFGGTGSLDKLNARFTPTEGTATRTITGYVNDDDALPVYRRSFEPVYMTQFGNSYGGYANLTLRWNLFNGGQIRRAVESSRIREKIGLLSIDQIKLNIDYNLASTFDLYNLRRQLVLINEAKLKAAELNLALATERYRNGALSAIDLRIVQENFRIAALDKSFAIFNATAARINLVRLTGGLISDPDKQN